MQCMCRQKNSKTMHGFYMFSFRPLARLLLFLHTHTHTHLSLNECFRVLMGSTKRNTHSQSVSQCVFVLRPPHL